MNRLKELRKEKKLSQKEIAKERSISEKTLSRWENGESQIKPDKAQRLADYFGVSVGYLLGYNEGHNRIHDLFGTTPKKGDMGIIELSEMIGLNFIKSDKEIKDIQSDILVALKFSESLQNKLVLYGSVSKTYTNQLEHITSFFLDLYSEAENRIKRLSNE